jgi:hypothetical protein
MGNFYVRVGNRTLKGEEYRSLTSKDRQKLIDEGERATQKRLENMRKGLGLEPKQGITLDVTPQGVLKRQEAIKAEEAKLAAETSEETAVQEEPVKKSKVKKSKTVASE